MPEVDVGAPAAPPATKSIVRKQESARQTLAFLFTAILTAEIVFACTITWLPAFCGGMNMPIETLKDIMTIVFTPTVALVGSAAGFYFGHHSGRQESLSDKH